MSFTVESDWQTKAGLRAVCIMNDMGFRCGYVEVPKDHSLSGKDYDDECEALGPSEYSWQQYKIPCEALDVHGGLTYAEGNDHPAKGGDWWFGFDCGHAGDATGLWSDGVHRSQHYVENECEKLAEQLARYA